MSSSSGFGSSVLRFCHVAPPHVGGQDQSCEARCDFTWPRRRQKLKLKPMKNQCVLNGFYPNHKSLPWRGGKSPSLWPQSFSGSSVQFRDFFFFAIVVSSMTALCDSLKGSTPNADSWACPGPRESGSVGVGDTDSF